MDNTISTPPPSVTPPDSARYVHIIERLVSEELGWTEPLPSTDFSEHLDSMQKLSLLVAIEDHFEISFEEEEDVELNTLDALIEAIQKKDQEKCDAESLTEPK